MRMRTALATVALATLATAFQQPAHAAAPTRISDTTLSMWCTANAGDDFVRIVAESSQLQGTRLIAVISTSDGEFVAYGTSTADWTETTFAGRTEVFDDYGNAVGTIGLDGTYVLADTSRTVDRFNDGNVHVTEDHTFTDAVATQAAATLDGVPLTDLDCSGQQVVGSLFFTNPATYTARFPSLWATDCTGSNVDTSAVFAFGSVDDLGLVVNFLDPADVTTAPVLRFRQGTWAGQLTLVDGDTGDPVADVPASATLTRSGSPLHVQTGEGPGAGRLSLTPYALHLEAGGVTAPISLDCRVYDVVDTVHVMPNQG